MKYLIILLLLSGCSLVPPLKDRLDSWILKSEDLLITRQGPPQSVYKVNDERKVLTYDFSTQPTTQTYYNPYLNTASTYTSDNKCLISFHITKGLITNYSYNGCN